MSPALTRSNAARATGITSTAHGKMGLMDLIGPVFMVRDADFGANFTPKAALALLGIGFVIWDMVQYRRRDYLWVFITGTVIWTAVELSLQLRGTRVMPVHLLFGQQIPLAVSAPLQGMAEGAAVAILGLFFADRLRDPRTSPRAAVGLALTLVIMGLLMVLQAARPDLPGAPAAASRRDITNAGALVVFALVTAFDVWFCVARARFRKRSLAMAAVMTVFATAWTVVAVLLGGRWIEVPGATPGTYAPAGPALSAAALSFDVVFEIVLAYVPFFAIPALLGLMTPDPAGRVSGCGGHLRGGVGGRSQTTGRFCPHPPTDGR